MSTYLVTGASGFVGAALTRRLLEEGHKVRLLLRADSTAALVAHERTSVHNVSLGDPNALAAIARGVDVVYHCAAENSPRAYTPAFAWVNVAGTENVLNAARHARVRRVVHLSCADATLINGDRLNWKELHPLTTRPLDALSRSKLLADELAVQASGHGLEVCVLRPAWVWGPGDRGALPSLCREAQKGGITLCGNGENLVPTVYIDNLVHALRLADRAERAPGQIFHVLDSEAQTAREFIGALCRAVGLPSPRRGSYTLSYTRACLNEWLNLPGFARGDVVRRGRSALFDGMAAANDLGYQPVVRMADGMRALSDWAAAIGGYDAIARFSRRLATKSDVEGLIRIADAADAGPPRLVHSE